MGGQTGGNVVPDLGERIGARAPGMRRVRLTGQLPRAAVLARRLFIHARLGGSQSQSSFGVAQRQKPPHLLICDHSSLLAMDWNKSIRCKPAGVLIVVWAEIYLSLFTCPLCQSPHCRDYACLPGVKTFCEVTADWVRRGRPKAEQATDVPTQKKGKARKGAAEKQTDP